MGRGRAKAKQTKVARQLKYNTGGTDLARLADELGASPSRPVNPEPVDDDDELDDDDPYAQYADLYNDDDEDEEDDQSSGSPSASSQRRRA
ncbi:DUF3073 domain-containing protein [Actinacidiphila epipremni]|jgi:hypothetical protein|uniref:DUF3073 domain-containing protein n=1 Tax=Actinacidiphila epipremni TaxID=2053013 RepID=A0ABX0ZVA8_9ACTN|nr:DUF3073 domain-containing protein [Actinacidiphila epipremni]NJP46587.1 DUF3073 domain-containing protein [Actinacidiphila epipremni]